LGDQTINRKKSREISETGLEERGASKFGELAAAKGPHKRGVGAKKKHNTRASKKGASVSKGRERICLPGGKEG